MIHLRCVRFTVTTISVTPLGFPLLLLFSSPPPLPLTIISPPPHRPLALSSLLPPQARKKQLELAASQQSI